MNVPFTFCNKQPKHQGVVRGVVRGVVAHRVVERRSVVEAFTVVSVQSGLTLLTRNVHFCVQFLAQRC